MAKGKGGFLGQDGLNAPDQATGVTASAGDGQATVSWTAPSDTGSSAITGYQVQSNNGDGDVTATLANAVYDGLSFSVASQDANPTGVAFNSDGTKMYISGNSNDNVFQYSLSTAFDVSTASYDNVSLSVTPQTTVAIDLTFKPDGSVLYVSGTTAVYQYTLSTSYDLSTASYASKSLTVSSQQSSNQSVKFNDDGTSVFIVGTSPRTVFQYTLSTAWDLSTGSYASKSFSVEAQDTQPSSLAFSTDGNKMFVLGRTADAVYQYSLSSSFDVSTASYDSVSLDVSGLETNPFGITFSGNMQKMYIVGTSADSVFQYTTSYGEYPTSSPVTITGLTNGTNYTFNVWAINASGWSAPSEASDSVTPAFARGLFGGGYTSTNTIDYIDITNTGNATDFGDLTVSRYGVASCSSETRGLWAGGFANLNVIDYVTIASTGNATDFGDLTVGLRDKAGCSSSTRGLFGGGQGATSDVIDYVTIASAGNATDFGNLTVNRAQLASFSSPTRGVWAGGFSSTNVIDYVTIASTGNATDFGDLTSARYGVAGCSNSTRGLIGGGYANLDNIDYVTIASAGNAADFGNLTVALRDRAGCASTTRGVFAGGQAANSNVIDYVEIGHWATPLTLAT
jgi:hypothetical protein